MRALLLLLTVLLTACTTVPEAPDLPEQAGYLTKKTTRQLVEHWAGNGFPKQVAGRPIHLVDQHPEVSTIADLIPAENFSQDSKDKNSLGTVVMVHEDRGQLLKKVNPDAWQLTTQPATIIARSEPDGSLKLTALDFRDQTDFRGLPLASNFRTPFDYVRKQ